MKIIKLIWNKLRSEDKLLFKNSFWNLTGSISSKVLMLITSVFIARFLGANIYGQWGVIRSTALMFTTFLSFGVGITAMKHLAEFRKINPDKASSIFSISLYSAVVFGLLLSLIMYFTADFLSIGILHNIEIAIPLKISSVYLLLTAISGVFSGALMGLDAYRKLAFANFLISLIGAPIIILFTYYYQLSGVTIAYAIYYLLAVIIYIPLLKRELRLNKLSFKITGIRHEIPLLFKFSIPAMISGAIGGPVVWAANAIVARMNDGFIMIGIYNAAKIPQNTAIEIGNQIHNPLITLVSNEKSRRSNALSFFVPTLFNAIFILPLIFFPELVNWMFSQGDFLKPEFGLIVSISMFTGYIIIYKQSLGRLIITNNKVWWGVYENILWSILLLGILQTLTKQYQASGLAGAYFLSYFFDLIILFPFYKYYKMVPGFVFYNKYFLMAFAISFVAPLLIFMSCPLYLRIMAYAISLVFHVLYLSQFKTQKEAF